MVYFNKKQKKMPISVPYRILAKAQDYRVSKDSTNCYMELHLLFEQICEGEIVSY